MEENLDDEQPRYRILNSPGFFAEDDTLYTPGTEIVYLGTPNEHMQPLNDAARARVKQNEDYLDRCYREKAQMRGREAGPRPRDLAEASAEDTSDAREIARQRAVYPVEGKPIPVMGNMTRRRGAPKNIVSAKTPGSPKRQAPKPIGSMTQSNSGV